MSRLTVATFGKCYGASSSSSSYFINRTTRFGGFGSETERGYFDSHEYRTRLEFGRHLDGLFGFGGTLTPFLALEIAELRSNGLGETPGYLGLRYQTAMPLGGMTFLPSLQVAYVHEFAPYRSQTGAIADLPASTFLVRWRPLTARRSAYIMPSIQSGSTAFGQSLTFVGPAQRRGP